MQPYRFANIRMNVGLWALLIICSIVITVMFVQPVSTSVDIQKERFFHGFGEAEMSERGEFRWSFINATLLFPQRWIDYAWFPQSSIGQLTTIRVQDIYEGQELRIGNMQFAIDAQPRFYQILTAQQPVISFEATKINISPEQRQLGVPLFSAEREPTTHTWADYFFVWLCVLCASMGIVIITALLQRIIAPSAPWWVSLLHVGIWLMWWVASPAGNGEIVLAWGFVGATLLMIRWILTPWRWSWILYLAILLGLMSFRIWSMWGQFNLSSDIELHNYKPYLPLPFEWEPYWSWTVWLLVLLGVRLLAGREYILDAQWLLWSAGCSFLSMLNNGYWPAHGWMNIISLEYLGSWSGVWEFLRTSRVAVSPLLLIAEFAVQGNALWMLAYGWIIPRAILFAAMLLAVFRGVTTPRERLIRGALLMVWTYAFTMIKPLDNYFIYDFLLGALLLFAIHLAYRRDIVPWQWAVVGILLVLMDTMRPFGMLILAVVVPWLAIKSWRTHHLRGVVYLCIPLVLSVVWHGHHIINLGQSNWSNHTGFNLCNAWECPTPPDLYPEAPPLADGLWTNINTEAHEHNSRQLLKSGFIYQITHPFQSIVRAGELLFNIVNVPFVAGIPALIGNGWWIDVYRFLMLGMMIAQLLLMFAVIGMLVTAWRTRVAIHEWYMVGHVLIIIMVLIIPNLVEYGENYRFIAGTAMWLAAIPAWDSYRAFVKRWLFMRSS